MTKNLLPAALALGGLLLTPAPAAADGVDLGLAGKYTVFALGSNVTLGVNDDTLNVNSGKIFGDVAIGAGTASGTGLAGIGYFQKGFIDGSLYADKTTALSPGHASFYLNKDFGVTGAIDGAVNGCSALPRSSGCSAALSGAGGTDLVSAVKDAMTASATYDAMPTTGVVPGGSIDLNGATATQTITSGVYDITNFYMNSGATLTIQGGATDAVVLNITGIFDFTKSFIQLQGGIQSANVLFNVLGPGPDGLGGSGSTVKVSGDNSIFYGTILAVSRSIFVQGIGSKPADCTPPAGGGGGAIGCSGVGPGNPGFEGKIIGALSPTSPELLIKIYSGAEINGPPPPPPVATPEPLSVVLLGLGLGAFAYRRRSRR